MMAYVTSNTVKILTPNGVMCRSVTLLMLHPIISGNLGVQGFLFET